tara:strand:+ start:310 stop:684 length:375 start_codon:yes stop_codon:yes gene_type:complete
MLCPKCFSKSDVADSRHLEKDNIIRRRRQCKKCGNRFGTLEIQTEDLAKIEDKVNLIGSALKHFLLLDHVAVSRKRITPEKKETPEKSKRKPLKRVLTPKVAKQEVEPDWDSMTDEEIEALIGS